MFKAIFWTVTFLILYTYFIYPALIALLAAFKPSLPEAGRDFLPQASMVISVYNEEEVILKKLDNCLKLDYPEDKLEILIGSDGSTDKTNGIIEKCGDSRIKFFKWGRRRGKISVLNDLAARAKGEIIVFSDANTMYEAGALKNLLRPFVLPEVGCVSGRLILREPAGGSAEELEGAYWAYEDFLKRAEGKMGVLLGANGAIYAIRKDLFRPLPAGTIVEDFVIPMKILESKRRVVYEPLAKAYEETSRNICEEMVRKTRIAAGDFQAMFLTLPMLNIFRGLPSFAYWSHKIIRWQAPFLSIAALASNAFLMNAPLYRFTMSLQAGLYIAALAGLLLRKKIKSKPFFFPYYFVSMNWSLLVGLYRLITKKQKVTWAKAQRQTNAR